MEVTLNTDQAKALSNFFFDIAKGTLVGSLGFSASISDLSIFLRVTNILGGVILTYICIKIGLSLLEK